MSDDEVVADPLEGSPILNEVLGAASEKLSLFHVKLSREGQLRGVIGPRDAGILWERHILNSAAVVPFIKEAMRNSHNNRVVDVGSGGGFPGIVAAACLPDYPFTLMEPMERRVEWLAECVELLKLNNVHIVRDRAELVISRHEESHPEDLFHVVICRAVAPLTRLVGWTLPLVEGHGRLIALKGQSAQHEIDKASKQISHFHGVHPRVCEAPVGPGLQSTHVVLIDKR
ncbi:MAG: 16S rRNA (guanine(527)-N(7))-methyltransferase RsmG [Bifidobacterium sp.]|jgi:16S rRNA (guanine527-N7)-methyltransferase|nr:16S rRNA (guanine(527)-N(7))-methyltransferase RsmG [Bifidobacterium sp.]MCI1864927.1 16S rRNA (guanine(527)-N(7))-methyltransferase RsmG [Bifidobacterium sp.]